MRIEKLDNREIAYIATFGALWGASEITLGFMLHNFRLPFIGLLMTVIGSVIALTCYKLTNKKRAIIYVALIAATLKMLSFTTVKLWPIVGIIGSAVLAQAVVFFLSSNLFSYMIASGLMCSWSFILALLIQLIVYSPEIFNIYQKFLNAIGLKNLALSTIIIVILTIHFLVGLIAGAFAWDLSEKLLQRLKFKREIFET